MDGKGLTGNWPTASYTLPSTLLPLDISFDSLASVVIIRSPWITFFSPVLWRKVGFHGSRLYFPVLAQPVHLCLYVTSVLAFLLTNSGLSPRVFAYLVNVCSYLVWIQRNDFRFHSIPPSAVKVIALMKARLSFHLPLFSRRFTSTRRRSYLFRPWAANGMFGSFRNSTFTFTLQ